MEKVFDMCHRQSWRVGNDCKSFAFGLSRFESYVTHHFYTGGSVAWFIAPDLDSGGRRFKSSSPDHF